MPTHRINIARNINSAVVIGFFIILVANTSIVQAGDKNQDLIEAAGKGRLEEVQRLLNEGSDVNAKLKDGYTALMLASLTGHPEVVKALLEKGADINPTTRLIFFVAII